MLSVISEKFTDLSAVLASFLFFARDFWDICNLCITRYNVHESVIHYWLTLVINKCCVYQVECVCINKNIYQSVYLWTKLQLWYYNSAVVYLLVKKIDIFIVSAVCRSDLALILHQFLQTQPLIVILLSNIATSGLSLIIVWSHVALFKIKDFMDFCYFLLCFMSFQ